MHHLASRCRWHSYTTTVDSNTARCYTTKTHSDTRMYILRWSTACSWSHTKRRTTSTICTQMLGLLPTSGVVESISSESKSAGFKFETESWKIRTRVWLVSTAGLLVLQHCLLQDQEWPSEQTRQHSATSRGSPVGSTPHHVRHYTQYGINYTSAMQYWTLKRHSLFR